MRLPYIHPAYDYSKNDFPCRGLNPGLAGRELSAITARPGVSAIKLFSDLPSDLVDVPKLKSSRQKLPKSEDFFSMFYNEILPLKIFWQFFSEHLPNLADDPKKKIFV